MQIRSKYLSFLFFILLVFSHMDGYAQSKRQLELEERRRELQQEIRQITNLLFAGKKEKKSVVSAVEDLNYKISVRKKSDAHHESTSEFTHQRNQYQSK